MRKSKRWREDWKLLDFCVLINELGEYSLSFPYLFSNLIERLILSWCFSRSTTPAKCAWTIHVLTLSKRLIYFYPLSLVLVTLYVQTQIYPLSDIIINNISPDTVQIFQLWIDWLKLDVVTSHNKQLQVIPFVNVFSIWATKLQFLRCVCEINFESWIWIDGIILWFVVVYFSLSSNNCVR